jgi:hypothetical protein
MGDSGDDILLDGLLDMLVLRSTAGARGRVYCCFGLGGDELGESSLGFKSDMEDSRSAMRTFILVVSDGWRRDRPGPADSGGLDRELALLSSLYPEASEDCDSEGVWYGLPIPNSAAKFRLDGTGGASPSRASVLSLIRLAPLGGRGLERSGPEIDCFLCGDVDFSLPAWNRLLDSLDGLRIRGSEGLLEGS